MAEFVYCIRQPYIAVVYSAGGFRQTAISAYIEAILNIVLSTIFVFFWNLEGIAVGTLVGMVYRMIYQVVYISKHIIYRPICFFIKRIALSGLIMGVSLFIVFNICNLKAYSIFSWLINGIICMLIFTVVSFVMNFVFEKELLTELWKIFLGRRKK